MFNIVLSVILIIIGFIILIKGADYFVDSASNVANIFKVPSLIVGLTIVAFGTSAPEAAVSIAAGFNGSNAIAISNIVGSNIFNILIILGLCTIFGTLTVDNKLIKKDFSFLIVTSILLVTILIFTWQISRLTAILFLIIIISYVAYLIYDAKNSNEGKTYDKPKYGLGISIGIIIISLIGIIIGAEIVVNNTRDIALALGMSETLVGLTIVSIGTSLPELVTSLTAVRKGETGIAIGNIVGSNIFNILFILGVSGLINPIIVSSTMIVDLGVMLLSTIVCYIFIILDRKLDIKEGIVLIAMFIVYLAFIIMRN